MGTTTSYVPNDYRRICDLCGNLYNISKMRRQGPYTYCLDHSGERINEELDRGNAAQRPFRILPVPNAKPEDQLQPDVFESEESTIFALLDLTRAAGARFAQVASGMTTPLPNAADVIPINSWACIHYYGLALATYPKGHQDTWHAQALARMRTAADVLLALQSTSGTRATNSYYGGFLASGALGYYSEDAMTAGLASLYAYRILGDLNYLYAARAAASFLRNLQAIGSNGVNFPSTDSAGTSRLYTGGVPSFVSTAAGFYSDHCFYPSSLLALRFWNELKLTDGDQSLGATAAISGDFTSSPAKLMSACMADLRAFWGTGTRDATTGVVTTGLSASTPREVFNAYPFVKPNANSIGTGSWEYQDGPSSTGTLISALNFAKAISSLYAVDGLSAQVTALDDWLQTFTSNADFETAAGTSPAALAHATTGVYDCTQGVAQLLLVRDPDASYAATAKNGGSLYDWGAFGLLSPIWSSRHANGFKIGRNASCLRRRRLSDGLPSDGFWDDRGFLRGRQGLTMQTGFTEVLAHGPTSAPALARTVTAPPADNMVFWFKADAGVTMDSSNRVSSWADQGPNGWDVLPQGAAGFINPVGEWPVFVPNAINGLPALLWDQNKGTSLQHIYPPGTLNKPTPDGTPVTILALVKANDPVGGMVCVLRLTNDDLEVGAFHRGFGQIIVSGDQDGHSQIAVTEVSYANVTAVWDWEFYGASATPSVGANINGAPVAINPNSFPIKSYNGVVGFSIGYCNAIFNSIWRGYITEVMLYGGTDPATLATARTYLLQRSGQYSSALVYDGVAAAQFATALRQAPRS